MLNYLINDYDERLRLFTNFLFVCVCCLMLSIWNVKICAVLLIVKNQDINPEEELRIISFLKSIPAFTML